MNAPDKTAVLAHYSGLVEQQVKSKTFDIFKELSAQCGFAQLQERAVSAADELKEKIRKLPGMVIDIEELEIPFYNDVLVQWPGASCSVDYDYEPEERAYLSGPPEDCFPGCDASLTLGQIITRETITFEGEDGVTLTVPPMTNIGHLLTDKQVTHYENVILDKLREEAEEIATDAKISRYEDSRYD